MPPVAGSPLRTTLDALVAWLNGPDAGWPSSVPVASDLDGAFLARRLKMAAAWAGRCQVGAWQAGDGTASAEAELLGEHATLSLALAVDPGSGRLRLADIALG